MLFRSILAWYRQHYSGLPGTTDRAVRLGLLAYAVIGLLWTLLAIRLRSPRATAFVILPLVLSASYVAGLVLINVPTVLETIRGERIVRFQIEVVNSMGATLARLF